ncbi:hypothetical protein NTCA1_51150 [Novosphingobium sp. TCA1]|nr:hypothetical protein NTCA1_51150 [Novosphingobium sp. TCA1]
MEIGDGQDEWIAFHMGLVPIELLHLGMQGRTKPQWHFLLKVPHQVFGPTWRCARTQTCAGLTAARIDSGSFDEDPSIAANKFKVRNVVVVRNGQIHFREREAKVNLPDAGAVARRLEIFDEIAVEIDYPWLKHAKQFARTALSEAIS